MHPFIDFLFFQNTGLAVLLLMITLLVRVTQIAEIHLSFHSLHDGTIDVNLICKHWKVSQETQGSRTFSFKIKVQLCQKKINPDRQLHKRLFSRHRNKFSSWLTLESKLRNKKGKDLQWSPERKSKLHPFRKDYPVCCSILERRPTMQHNHYSSICRRG